MMPCKPVEIDWTDLEKLGIDSLPISPNEVCTYDVGQSANMSFSFKFFNPKR